MEKILGRTCAGIVAGGLASIASGTGAAIGYLSNRALSCLIKSNTTNQVAYYI